MSVCIVDKGTIDRILTAVTELPELQKVAALAPVIIEGAKQRALDTLGTQIWELNRVSLTTWHEAGIGDIPHTWQQAERMVMQIVSPGPYTWARVECSPAGALRDLGNLLYQCDYAPAGALKQWLAAVETTLLWQIVRRSEEWRASTGEREREQRRE